MTKKSFHKRIYNYFPTEQIQRRRTNILPRTSTVAVKFCLGQTVSMFVFFCVRMEYFDQVAFEAVRGLPNSSFDFVSHKNVLTNGQKTWFRCKTMQRRPHCILNFCGLLFHKVLCMALWGGRVTISLTPFIGFLIKDVMSSSIS